ncbi:MAG TPA: PD-(D/E)XK nuclease family protein [Rectinemataceae bacterium]|nr:PD-(D/E)XK nuclease family protein [Rectinemataceae bacterium]
MIDWIRELLAGAVADGATRFVFPSQAAADSWSRRAPALFGLAAVETARFMGWDRFKEERLSRRSDLRPADRVARMMWAATVVARQARSPFLRKILGPFPPSEAFTAFLARIPPSLALVGKVPEGLEDELLRDLGRLRADYAEFLATKALFEPGWESLPEPEEGERFFIIAPELMEDYDRYSSALEGRRDIMLCRLPAPELPTMLRFPSLFEELRWTFLQIARLLDEGCRPEDVAVTLPSLDAAAPYVRAAAERAGVPIALREGELLSSTPFGRALSGIDACVRRGFAFDAMRDLLLDRFLAWKGSRAEAARDLIQFGIEYHAYAPYTDSGRKVDVWEESFETSGGGRFSDLRAFYRDLKRALRGIATAGSFRDLLREIAAFRSAFLDESGWDEAEVMRVQRAMVELGSLVRSEEELGLAGGLPEPFALFLRLLGETRYVPRGGEVAVPVYPYRVSALLCVRHHFVLGCSQDGTSVRYAALPYLREDQKERLGLADRDASGDFSAAYALDSGCRPSYAEQGIGGWSAPAPRFPSAPPSAGEHERLILNDPLAAEARAWSTAAGLPAALLPMQKEAALRAAPSLAAKGSDYGSSGTLASSRARVAVLAPRLTAAGLLRLSATQLEEYLACPFGWLLARGLGLEEEPSGVGFFDARLAGEMAHAAIRALFQEIAASGPFVSAQRARYEALIPAVLNEALRRFEAEKGPFLVPMFSAYRPLLADRLRRLLAAESWMEGWEAGEFEASFERDYPELGALLQGRADRVAQRGDEIAIIDYKKRKLPRKADLVIDPDPEGGGGLAALQIAAYVTLAEAGGGRVERAAYWSIEDAKRLVVVGEDGLRSREDYAAELLAFERSLAVVAKGLAAGDFRLGSGEACAAGGDTCGWAAICRCRYATE